MMETILTSSVLILIIVLLRYLLQGKISSRLQYALWALVAIRLLLPFSMFESPVSVMNVVPDTVGHYSSVVQPAVPVKPAHAALPADGSPAPQNGNAVSENPFSTVNTADFKVIAQSVRFCGFVLFGAFFIASNIRLSLKLRKGRKQIETPDCPLPVYIAGGLSSPCLCGILKPAVYLTPESLCGEQKTAFVLAHELTHYRQKDHIWSFVRMLCLCIHWFNPLVWLAAGLSRRDSELACDERTLCTLGDENRVEYGKTLIEMMLAPTKAADLFCCATTMTSGKGEITERIKRIARQPKMLMTTLAAVLLVSAAAVACTFGGVYSVTLADAVSADGFRAEAFDKATYGTLTSGDRVMDFSTAKAEEIASYIAELRVIKKQIDRNRESDRDSSNQIYLASDGFSENGITTVLEINFNADFTAVWVDDGVKPSFSHRVAKPNEAKEFFERQFGSVTQALETGFAEALWNARTPYVGDNSAVGKLLGLLPLPEGSLQHARFALRTTGNERGIEWVLQESESAPYEVSQFDLNALLLFALIDNLEDFYVTTEDPLGGGTKLHYDRLWADKTVGCDVRGYAESPEKLQELIDFFGDEAVYAQFRAEQKSINYMSVAR